MITLKPAHAGDAPVLLDIQRQAFSALLKKYQDYDTNPAAESLEQILWRLNCPDREYWIIRNGGQPVGLACIRHWEDALHVLPIGLAPEYQGRGIGRQAMALLEAQYPENQRWELATIMQESKLCRFYESLGYRRTGFQKEIQPGMDLVGYGKLVY